MSRFGQHGALSPYDSGGQTRAVVKWFNLAKGFGFVAPVDGSPDAFLHISVLNRAGIQQLAEGTEIVCRIAEGPKGPQVAEIITVVGGTEAAAPDDQTARGGRRSPAPRGSAYGAASGEAAEVSGTVKWFKSDKGFGFVTADDAGKDIFIHKSVLRRCGLDQIESGQRVQMRVQEAEKGREATWIVPL